MTTNHGHHFFLSADDEDDEEDEEDEEEELQRAFSQHSEGMFKSDSCRMSNNHCENQGEIYIFDRI